MIFLLFISLAIKVSDATAFVMAPFGLRGATYSHSSAIYEDELTIIYGSYEWTSNTDRTIPETISLNEYQTGWIMHYGHNLPNSTGGITETSANSVQINNLLYVMNAEITDQTSLFVTLPPSTIRSYQNLIIYDLSVKQWVHGKNQPPYGSPKSGICMTHNIKDNLLYGIGGYYLSALDSMQIYNISNDSWSEGSTINIARFAAGCAMDSNSEHIFIFGGGVSYYGLTDSIEKYYVSNNSWVELTETLNTSKSAVKCILYPVDGNIYCLGGTVDSKNLVYTNLVEVFNTASFQIQFLQLNTPRVHAAVSLWDNKCMIISGGLSASVDTLSSIEYSGECSFQDGLFTSTSLSTTATTTLSATTLSADTTQTTSPALVDTSDNSDEITTMDISSVNVMSLSYGVLVFLVMVIFYF